MLYREIIAVCSQIHRKHINTLCGQNVEFFNVKPGRTYGNNLALKGSEKCTTKGNFPKLPFTQVLLEHNEEI
jgi:hypothetical protein